MLPAASLDAVHEHLSRTVDELLNLVSAAATDDVERERLSSIARHLSHAADELIALARDQHAAGGGQAGHP